MVEDNASLVKTREDRDARRVAVDETSFRRGQDYGQGPLDLVIHDPPQRVPCSPIKSPSNDGHPAISVMASASKQQCKPAAPPAPTAPRPDEAVRRAAAQRTRGARATG